MIENDEVDRNATAALRASLVEERGEPEQFDFGELPAAAIS